MTTAPKLHWLPVDPNWRAGLRAFAGGAGDIARAVGLANTQLDFVQTNALDSAVRQRFSSPPGELVGKPVRLAVLGSSTFAHLLPSLRVAGLRRGIWIDTYENDYGQYYQELMDPGSALHAFAPTAILMAFDARHATQGAHAGLGAADRDAVLAESLDRIRSCWSMARAAFNCPVLQQTIINVFPAVLGNNEHRLPGSRRAMVDRLNQMIRDAAETDGVDLVAVDDRVAVDGLAAWHDPLLWHRSKQEVTLAAGPFWGDLVGRVLAARQGRSFKCLVLDLDNTLWGGVIGDDGLNGIVLGQGSALGEGFVAVQDYARELSRRGIILAVASKNDEANALEPFEKHPEMVLTRKDIAAFRADWNDKAGNIKAIAAELNIGIDSIVFLDDNPFERTHVREELPMLAVPEVPDDPGLVPRVLADAGYFEGVTVTSEDRERTQQYQGNVEREKLKATATDMESYLRGLNMKMVWRRFDDLGLGRTTQLINKTNQFNLTTRRYTEEEVKSVTDDPRAFGLQIRLLDRFGDNGVIAIVIGRLQDDDATVLIDTWLMSCRVLGRQVEPTTLNLVAAQARRLGATRLIGEYIPTKKNGMVAEHYPRLGFEPTLVEAGGRSTAVLDLESFTPVETFIEVEEG
jgi:FkbH-like protein